MADPLPEPSHDTMSRSGTDVPGQSSQPQARTHPPLVAVLSDLSNPDLAVETALDAPGADDDDDDDDQHSASRLSFNSLPPYSQHPDSTEASSGIQTEQFGGDTTPSPAPAPAALLTPVTRSPSGGMFSRAEQAARMGLAGLDLGSSPTTNASSSTMAMDTKQHQHQAPPRAVTVPASFDEKKAPPRTLTSSPQQTRNGSPTLGNVGGRRDLKGGELLGTLKLEIVSITDLPVRKRSTLTNALLLNQKPERRWTPFVVVSYGATTYKTKVRSQTTTVSEKGEKELPMVIFNTPIPDIPILRSQTHWDVVFSLWDSQTIGTNKAIGTSLSVEVVDLMDPEQRDGAKFWESGPGRPLVSPATPASSAAPTSLDGAFIAGEPPEEESVLPPRRSFDSATAAASASFSSGSTAPPLPPRPNVFRAKSWTIEPSSPPSGNSRLDLGTTSPELPQRPSVELPMMMPSPTTDTNPNNTSSSSSSSIRPRWLTSKRTRSRSHSPAKVSKSGNSSGGSDNESSGSNGKGKTKLSSRRPLSPLMFGRSRSPATTQQQSVLNGPLIPGLRFPVMQNKVLEVERAPIVDSDGKVEELPPITLNVKVGFSPRSHLLRNYLVTVLHNIRVRQLGSTNPSNGSTSTAPLYDQSTPIEKVTILDVLLMNAEHLGSVFNDDDVDNLFSGRNEIPLDEFVELWDSREWEAREQAAYEQGQLPSFPPRASSPTPGGKKASSSSSIAKKESSEAPAASGSFSSDDAGELAPTTCFVCGEPFPPPDPTSTLPYAVQQMNHTLVCASKDYSATATKLLNRREFLTESAAARGLYTSFLARLGLGTYRVGRHEGYILVQRRETGQLEEEYIPSYVRLGIQLLYRSRVSRRIVEMNSVANFFRNTTLGHGARYDDPRSAAAIPKFIRTYSINVEEVEKPISEYKTLNDFFTRGLKPGTRSLDSPEDPDVIVSCADCRLTCFQTSQAAQQIWIKGSGFSITRLLGGDVEMGKEFEGCSVIVHRLAPQDYHRWHNPVDGRVVGIVQVKQPGLYYTVNPMAVRSPVDVYGENVREICYVDTGPDRYGLVAVVAVGAMLVGSIVWTVKEGHDVKRMDEMGYFKFGGSTVVVLVQKNTIQLDDDLLANSNKALETVVQVGNRLGQIVRPEPEETTEQQ